MVLLISELLLAKMQFLTLKWLLWKKYSWQIAFPVLLHSHYGLGDISGLSA